MPCWGDLVSVEMVVGGRSGNLNKSMESLDRLDSPRLASPGAPTCLARFPMRVVRRLRGRFPHSPDPLRPDMSVSRWGFDV